MVNMKCSVSACYTVSSGGSQSCLRGCRLLLLLLFNLCLTRKAEQWLKISFAKVSWLGSWAKVNRMYTATQILVRQCYYIEEKHCSCQLYSQSGGLSLILVKYLISFANWYRGGEGPQFIFLPPGPETGSMDCQVACEWSFELALRAESVLSSVPFNTKRQLLCGNALCCYCRLWLKKAGVPPWPWIHLVELIVHTK